MATQKIHVELAASKKEKPNSNNLTFGTVFTDHMFVMDYTEGQGWQNARITPYAPIELDPSATILHYGQTIFEGLKAYKTPNNDVQLFRPEQNFARMNRSAERMCMPAIDEDFALEALKQLVDLERDWIPTEEGTSLYIRPFMIATEAFLGVRPAKNYQFIIIMSPVGQYYAEGVNPVGIAVENEFVRAVRGGTGEAKTAGNYAASLMAQELIASKGVAQVLWLDGVERKYIEEVGSMNVFFKINGQVITPALTGSILPGITRQSTIELLKSLDIPVIERKLAMDEIIQAAANGTLEEAFGTGTAAVISPIGRLVYGDEEIQINNGQTGPIAKRVYDTITGIQYGTVEDTFGWAVTVD